MKFIVAGDAIIQRRIAEDFEGYAELCPFIKSADAAFFNLETTLNYEGEASVSQFSGGTYLRANPEVLYDLKRFGFNMTSFNNNHALDFFYDGFLSTLDAVNKSGLVHSGAGFNLAEASAPHYLETKNGRVALISVNTSFNETMLAGPQSPRVKGRPGINGIRIESYVELPQEDFDYIKKLGVTTNINAAKDISRKEGYTPKLDENECALGELKFKLGNCRQYVSKPNEADMTRLEKAIFEAKLQADYIIVSVHSHQLSGDKKENPSEFLKKIAHRAIDAGANAIVGHGPHLLRPIEVYKDSPIFYSLGDFALQLYSIEFAPEEFFDKHGLDSTATVHELLKKRSNSFTSGLMTDERMFRSVLPLWETENGKLTKLTLLPIELKMYGHKSEIGLPRQSFNPEIAEYLKQICEPYGTKISLNSTGLIDCEW